MLKYFKTLKIMCFLLYLFLWCQTTESLTNQLTDLGQNVTINCYLDIKEVTWMLLNLPDPPVLILRSFLNPPKALYFNKTFKQKFSVTSAHHLFIHNITINELGVYYCMNLDTTSHLSSGTRLYTTAPTQVTMFTECQNHTIVQYIQQNQTPWKTFTLILGLLNVVLVIVVIGLLTVCAAGHKISRRRSPEDHTTDLQQTQVQPQESNQPQYTEVDSSNLKTFRPSQVDCTYAVLQLPK
ncbi:uncharacterized protein LOC127153904 isoform X1 [Labeo rohita]|uniref:uncharacterized protein LOC127153904 isoform X1 n=1 Tax=Labeo rohita TaxID=84645 RepID=UPI0021E2F893|nr:uncharacterized protein LOC127153904 isoform X1 [Labeo rohita]